MKIGILGGTFDPPHIGHLIVASQIRETLSLDEIWLMPVFSHAFEKHLSSPDHRLAMTKLMEEDGIIASDYEIRRKERSYTIDTLRLLQKARPADTFYFCLGSDTLIDFQKWKEWRKLVTDYRLVVYPRGFDVRDIRRQTQIAFDRNSLPDNITLLEKDALIITNISSTLVRTRIRERKAVSHIIPAQVFTYIQHHHLYLEKLRRV